MLYDPFLQNKWEDDPKPQQPSVAPAAPSTSPGYFMPEMMGGRSLSPHTGQPYIDMTLPPADYAAGYQTPSDAATPTPTPLSLAAKPMAISGSVTAKPSSTNKLDKDGLLRMLIISNMLKQAQPQTTPYQNSITPWAHPFTGNSPLQSLGTMALLA